MKRLSLTLLAFLALSLHAFAASSSRETLDHLNTAFRGESNAHARYLAFATRADEEGHPQVAKLFRAAARAEAIHRDTHRDTIKELGGTVTPFELDPIQPGSTADNLRAAIAGETEERDNMYPGYLAAAQAENNRPAMRAFKFALGAEKEHAALYTEALAQLGKNLPVVDYYVCPVCGSTSAGRPDGTKCGTCRKPTADFIQTA